MFLLSEIYDFAENLRYTKQLGGVAVNYILRKKHDK
jgi:hypothetical protein